LTNDILCYGEWHITVNGMADLIDEEVIKLIQNLTKWGFAICYHHPCLITLHFTKIHKVMKARFLITSDETGTVILRRKRIAKALRWWLRQNGFRYRFNFFCN